MWRRFANKGEATEVATMTKIRMMSAIMLALTMTALPAIAGPSAHDQIEPRLPSSVANR